VPKKAFSYRREFTFRELKGDNYGFLGKDVISVGGFNRPKLDYLFGLAEEMRKAVRQHGSVKLLEDKVSVNLFYEPSTRTSSSFAAAMNRLGGKVISITDIHSSSVAKGESLPDTIKTLEQYSDVIVLRHPEVGSARLAAKVSNKPIINAGDGIGEHPTQALLDLFTIREKMGTIDGLTVTMIGDLKFGRTVHSLTQLLSLFKVNLAFVSPLELQLPRQLLAEIKTKRRGISIEESTALEKAIGRTDVLYVTRIQKERFSNQDEYEKVENCCIVTPELLRNAKKRMIVMHPLPRINEIDFRVDLDPRLVIFRQVENGMYIRMALLAAVLYRS